MLGLGSSGRGGVAGIIHEGRTDVRVGVEGGKTGGDPARICNQGEGGQGRPEAESFDCFMDGVLKTPEGTGNGRGKTVELQVEESLW